MTPDEIAAARARAAAPAIATAADAPALAATLASAFTDDPIFRWWLRDDARYGEVLARVFANIVPQEVKGGHAYHTGDGAAAALWQPPGVAEAPFPLWQRLLLAPALLPGTGFVRLPRIYRLFDFMGRHHPKTPHFYLFFLGVARDAQGAGVGAALLASTLAKVDAAGMPAYLENSNPKNTRLYERAGFKTVFEGPVAAGPGVPAMQCMWRAARA